LTRIRFAASVAVFAGLLGAGFVAVSVGATESPRAPVHAGSGAYQSVRVSVSAGAASSRLNVAYVYGNKTVQPGQEFDAPLRCPKRFPHPISGGFDSNSNKTFLATSRPFPFNSSARAATGWSVGVTNLDTAPASVIAVIVCER
jgi:hypothetical protein